MTQQLLKKLTDWRDKQAKKEDVESYRVLPFKPLEEIARTMPTCKEELISIKGIKEKKWQKYGKEILGLVNGGGITPTTSPTTPPTPPIRGDERRRRPPLIGGVVAAKSQPLSVSAFLDFLNDKLRVEQVRVKGEVSSVDARERVVYFSLKDKEDESVVSCLMFRSHYDVCGVEMEIGQEVIVEGHPDIYKPNGRLSLKTETVELVGEGALKKAYEKLKKKLEDEGLFAPEKKKILPELPQTIGLITSSQGAAIGDFTTNLGKFGFKIKFVNSSVEGSKAVFELIRAVKRFNQMSGVDVLAIVRGGGSLESLQAFNNEALVREVAKCKIPIICGVGHEKDITLTALAADVMVSTPTAVAEKIGESWEQALQELELSEKNIINQYSALLINKKHQLTQLTDFLTKKLTEILNKFTAAKQNFYNNLLNFQHALKNSKAELNNIKKLFINKTIVVIDNLKNKINHVEKILAINNPERQLRLGYSIVSLEGKIVRSVGQVSVGDELRVRMADGGLGVKVNDIRNSN